MQLDAKLKRQRKRKCQRKTKTKMILKTKKTLAGGRISVPRAALSTPGDVQQTAVQETRILRSLRTDKVHDRCSTFYVKRTFDV